MNRLEEAFEDSQAAKAAWDKKFPVLAPENKFLGRPDHLVTGKMLVLLGKDEATKKPTPWLAQIIAIDGTDLRVAWYRSANNALKNKWNPVKKKGENEGNVPYASLPIVLDWGFDLVEGRIPADRLILIQTTFDRLKTTFDRRR